MSKKPIVIEMIGFQASGKTEHAKQLNSCSSINSTHFDLSSKKYSYKTSPLKTFLLLISYQKDFLIISFLLFKLSRKIIASIKRAILILYVIEKVNKTQINDFIILEEGVYFYTFTFLQYHCKDISYKSLNKLLRTLTYGSNKTIIIKIEINQEIAVKRAIKRSKNNQFDNFKIKQMLSFLDNSKAFLDYIYDNCNCYKRISIDGNNDLAKNINAIVGELKNIC